MFDCNSFLHRKGWVQRDLAERLGIGTSTVGMWCTGKSKPSKEMIAKLLELGVTPKELWGEKIDYWLRKYYNDEIKTNNKGFSEGVTIGEKPMTREEVIELFKSMKERGEI